jgi:DNA topoisomerase-1
MFDKLAFDVLAKFKRKKKLETGTVVYEYSEKQVAERNRRKAQRLEKLRKSIKHLRSQIKRDLTSEDPEKALTALAVGLMDATAERVGSNASAEGNLNEDGEPHFGVTTWTKKHISFGKGGATIKYVGKSGVKHTKKLSDAGLVKALRKAYDCIEGDDCIFNLEKGSVGGKHVNAYLKTFGVTAKDIRGLHCNQGMLEALKAVRSKGGKLPEDKKERQKKLKDEFKKALEEVAENIGHEPSTLRSQYLVPGLEERYLKDGTVSEKIKIATPYSYWRP